MTMWKWQCSRRNFGATKNILLWSESKRRWACAFKRIFIANWRVLNGPLFTAVSAGRSRIHCCESLMSLRGVAMLYERVLWRCAVRQRQPRDHNTYVRCIDIHRDRHSTLLPSLLLFSSLLLKQKARARPGDARLAARPPLLSIRFSMSLASSRLLSSCTPTRTYVYEQCDPPTRAYTLEKPNLDDPTAHHHQIRSPISFICLNYFHKVRIT